MDAMIFKQGMPYGKKLPYLVSKHEDVVTKIDILVAYQVPNHERIVPNSQDYQEP